MNDKNYESQRAEAQKLANEAAHSSPDYARRGGCDFGLERNFFGTYRFWRLPLPHNRCGHELRCEIVLPEINRF